MNIDQLPNEMLSKILSYLPQSQVSLVSKKFYDIACQLNDPNTCLRVDDHFFEQEWMSSIRTSTREISKIVIDVYRADEDTLGEIISVIKKFSTSIKYLKFEDTTVIALSEFLEILSLVPSVKLLDFAGLRIRTENKPITSIHGDLQLSQLHTLRLQQCDDTFLEVINWIPVGVLTELELHGVDLDALTILLKRQTSIEKLILTEIVTTPLPTDIFNNLKLESLQLAYIDLEKFDITEKLLGQTKLKSLTLHRSNVDQYFTNFVAKHFTELETFSMDVYNTTAESIEKVSNIKTLKSLSLSFTNTKQNLEQLHLLAQKINTKITVLNLFYVDFKTISDVRRLAKCVPNLKVLKFHSRNFSLHDDITKHFNFIESLEMNQISDNQLNYNGCFNPKLVELILCADCGRSVAATKKLIECYPNLKKLVITRKPIIITTSIQFIQILDGFKYLETLKLHEEGNILALTVDDLRYMLENKNNLKFVSLARLNFTVPDDLQRKLRTAFTVIIYGRKGTLHMAVDRVTMNGEYC